jgi:GTP-binding protein EngB required for normal cell division
MRTRLHSAYIDQVTALIDGLERLEAQYRTRGALQRHPRIEQQLILTLALLRNTVAPTVLGVLPPPVHVAVVGGTNCGKSTVTNVLVGDTVARASLQGGFTRIPTGYAIPDLLSGAWHDQPLMLKRLRAQGDVGAGGTTEAEYALGPLRSPVKIDYLSRAVIWDTPDIDSRYAQERQHRVLEIIGLADVVVLVLSKEKYADQTAYELLSLLLASGKPVVVCLNKFTSAEFPEGLQHFRRHMLDTPERQQAVGEPVMLPYVDPAVIDHLWATCDGVAAPVRQAVAAHLRQPERLRQQSAQGAVHFVAGHLDALLQPAWRECALRTEWHGRVEAGLAACMAFYRQHYLEDERRYDSFRLALFRLIELLDVPGINRVTRLLRQVVTAPVRWSWGLLKRLVAPEPPASPRAEVMVLQESVDITLTALHTFLLERQDDHPFWRQLRERFAPVLPALMEGVTSRLHMHEQKLTQAIDVAAHRIYARLQESPAQLHALRGGKLALEVAVTLAAVKSGGLAPDDLLYGSLAYAGLQTVVQMLGEHYVHGVKKALQDTQAAAVEAVLRDGVVAPLLALPLGQNGTQLAPLQEADLQHLAQCAHSLALHWRG